MVHRHFKTTAVCSDKSHLQLSKHKCHWTKLNIKADFKDIVVRGEILQRLEEVLRAGVCVCGMG